MARAALRWRIEDLAHHAHVTRATVVRAEQDLRVHRASSEKIREALERAGVQFIADPMGPTVRLAATVRARSVPERLR